MKKVMHFLKGWWLLVAIVVIVAAIAIFHFAGFRLAPGLTITRTGTLTLTNVPQTATIYVDEVYNRKSTGGNVTLKLLPGSHQIIVTVDGDQPWYDYVDIASDVTTSVSPLSIPLNPAARSVGNDGINTAASVISRTHLPTMEKPLPMEGGCALVSVQGNRIVADATTTPTCTPPSFLCTEGTCGPTVLFAPVEPIHTVIAFPGRDDAMIVSAGNKLFVLDVDPRNAFFAPLSTQAALSNAPRAAVDDKGTIYVYSGLRFFTLEL